MRFSSSSNRGAAASLINSSLIFSHHIASHKMKCVSVDINSPKNRFVWITFIGPPRISSTLPSANRHIWFECMCVCGRVHLRSRVEERKIVSALAFWSSANANNQSILGR